MRAGFTIFRKELADYVLNFRMTMAMLVACFSILWVAGNLSVEESSYRALLYGTGEEVTKAADLLSQISSLDSEISKALMVDPEEMRLKRADFALAQRGRFWIVYHQAVSIQQEAALARYAASMAWLLNDLSDAGNRSDMAAAAIDFVQSGVSRLGAMPRPHSIMVVPRTIALLTILVAFILGARSYSRDAQSGVLPLLFVARRARWSTVIAAKLAATVILAMLLFLLLLEAAYLIYGISIKYGLPQQGGVQMLAVITSASLGLSAAILAKSETYLYIFTGIYVILLVVLSGFLLPLDGAAPIVRFGAYASPLTFAGRLLEEWSFYGVSPLSFPREVILIFGQCLAALAVLGTATFFARRRA